MTSKTRYTRAEASQEGGEVLLSLASHEEGRAFITLSPQQARAFASALIKHADRAMDVQDAEHINAPGNPYGSLRGNWGPAKPIAPSCEPATPASHRDLDALRARVEALEAMIPGAAKGGR
jgi:hypothetical protein